MTETMTHDSPRSVHVMAKPSGAVCNIDCTYCFYLEKEKLYPEKGKEWKMNDETLRQYVMQYIEAQDVPEVNFAWQGGEPTLMGLEFFRKAVALQSEYANGYGRFLSKVFEEWVRKDVGRYFVQIFDVALGAWLGQNPSLCIFSETCGDALNIEHNGDLYSCDHYVYPDYHLGNVHEQSSRDLVASPQQRKFGTDKRDTLPKYCQACDFRFACNGGCPKHRFILTPDGEKGLNYFCKGYKMFFETADPYLRVMAKEISTSRPAAGVMAWAKQRDQAVLAQWMLKVGRNELCPCASGKKYKQCHGRKG